MEITKREILVSVVIVLVMITIGLFISTAIANSTAERNEVYYKALKINSAEQFKYGMHTSIGNALVYGEFKSVESITIPELKGEYLSIRKITQRYTQHERTVYTYDDEGNVTGSYIEIYYEWDTVGNNFLQSKTLTFMNVEFPCGKFALNNEVSLDLNVNTVSDAYQSWIGWGYLYNNADMWSNVGDLRFCYDVTPFQFNGTIFASLKGDSIINPFSEQSAVDFYNERVIQDVIKDIESSQDTPVILFWIFWILLTGGAVFGFFYLQNDWLNSGGEE